MKKILLTFIAAIGLAASANAQLALENFNSGTLPAGWVLISDGHTVSTSFANTALETALDAAAYVPVDLYGTGDYSMITTSVFTPAAAANRWLITPAFTVTSANMVLQWDDYDLNSGEPVHVLASATAGTTAPTFTATLYDQPTGNGAFVTHQLPIGSYVGQTIRMAFLDDTTDNWGFVIDNVETVVLSSLDLGVTSLYMYPYVQVGSSNPITGSIHNYGIATTTSFNINYSINGGTPVTATLTGLSNPLGSDYNFTATTPWVPTTPGIYTIKVWADQINGAAGVDGNHANDTNTITISVIQTLQPKKVLVEEFNQASCDPCAAATPNLDTVFDNNAGSAYMVRYHVNFPGRDCMDSVTLVPFVGDMLTLYGVNGVPDAQVDGQYVYPGIYTGCTGCFTSTLVQKAVSVGSPVTITVATSFNGPTHTYSFTSTVTSFGALPAGLKLRAALTIDTITYAANQSTESIAQTVFPQVAENMFPNAAGTTLAAFTTGSTQTVTGSWTKDHPWGSDRAIWPYDSTVGGHITVWVENDNYDYVYQSISAPVTTVFTSGVNTVTNSNGSMNIFPNPASKTVSIALNLTADADVKIEMFNVAGQLVYTLPNAPRNLGVSVSTFDASSFANGEYFVKVMIGDQTLTQKVTIAK